MNKIICLLLLVLSITAQAENSINIYGGLGFFSDRIKEGGQLGVYSNRFGWMDVGLEYTQWAGSQNLQYFTNNVVLEIDSGDTRALKVVLLANLFSSETIEIQPKFGFGVLEDGGAGNRAELKPLLSVGFLVRQPIMKNLDFTLNTDAMFSSYSYNGGIQSDWPTGFESIDISLGLTLRI
jgi:hypothetical protein